MTTIVAELCDALRLANVPEDQARRAAEAVLQGDGKRLERIEADLSEIKGEVRSSPAGLTGRIDHLESRPREVEIKLGRHDWMFGAIIVLLLFVLGKLFHG